MMTDRIEDGGPAFPEPVAISPSDDVYPAYGGMSLRDWFAGQALAGLYASGPHDCDQHGIAHDAYLVADAMIAARQKGGS